MNTSLCCRFKTTVWTLLIIKWNRTHIGNPWHMRTTIVWLQWQKCKHLQFKERAAAWQIETSSRTSGALSHFKCPYPDWDLVYFASPITKSTGPVRTDIWRRKVWDRLWKYNCNVRVQPEKVICTTTGTLSNNFQTGVCTTIGTLLLLVYKKLLNLELDHILLVPLTDILNKLTCEPTKTTCL